MESNILGRSSFFVRDGNQFRVRGIPAILEGYYPSLKGSSILLSMADCHISTVKKLLTDFNVL